MKKGRIEIALLIVSVIAAGSCSRIGVRDRYGNPEKRKNGRNELYNAAIISGSIAAPAGWNRDLCIIAWPVNPDKKRLKHLDYVIVKGTHEYMIYVPVGRYTIHAFSDANRNRVFESREYAGSAKGEIDVKENDLSSGIDIQVQNLRDPAPPIKVTIPNPKGGVSYTVSNGMVRKIYDEIFCQHNADIGWWEPTTFMRSLGANIYLLDKYDPSKIPILFVHGARGGPRDWIYMLMRLDTDRYQPLLFYYPTGMRLPLAARLLQNRLMELQKKLSFTRIHVTAHSMGGIVSRALLTQHSLEPVRVDRYVTLATPWSGYDSANFAVKNMSKTLPSWIDIASNSEFIERILRARLPESIDYYLFYGREDFTSKGRALDERSLAGGDKTFGYDVDHVDILKSREVFRKYREILE